jgi:hypothetical protein
LFLLYCRDKRVVREPDSEADIWWGTGSPNYEMDERTFILNRERAVDYLNTLDRLYVFDGYAGWDTQARFKIRVVCARPYHALFMHNMLIRCACVAGVGAGQPGLAGWRAAGSRQELGRREQAVLQEVGPLAASDIVLNAAAAKVRLQLCGEWCCDLVAHASSACQYAHRRRPTEDELHDFGLPDFTIYNGGAFPANRYTSYMTSSTSIDVSLKHKEMVSEWAAGGLGLGVAG